jgi:hypothetical protein
MIREVGGQMRRAAGDDLFRLVQTMDVPQNEARSRAQFERLVRRMEEEEEKRQRFGKWARMAWAVSTAAVGAGAFRLFAR